MKIAFYTLGCKVNQYETQALEQLVTQRGHSLVPFEEAADAYVINTCTVTAVSDKKSRQVIRRARHAAPGAVVAVCGCYPQTHPGDVEKLGVDLIAGTGDRTGFVDLLERTWRERRPVTALDDAFARRTFEALPAGGLEGRTRAMLKIQDGCVNFCSYCIIPYARGPVRSLPLADCVRQARELEGAGYREIVLTGIEISSWGRDLEGRPELIEAIEAICQALSPDTRVRLGSLEPRTITPDFCRRAAALPNLCPHFHLSLQSGCDATLARMNRKYDSARYYDSVRFLPGRLRPPRHHHRSDHRLPRGDGGGVPGRPWRSSRSAPSPPCTSSPTPAGRAPRRPSCPGRCSTPSRRSGPTGPPRLPGPCRTLT